MASTFGIVVPAPAKPQAAAETAAWRRERDSRLAAQHGKRPIGRLLALALSRAGRPLVK